MFVFVEFSLQLPKTLSGTEQCESGAAAVNKFPFTMVQVERIDRLVDTAQPVPSRHQSVPNCLELLFSTWRWLEGRGHAVPLFVGRSLDLDDSVITRICDWMRARFVRPPQRAPQIIKQTMFDDIKVYNNSTIANWYNRSPILRTEPIPKHDDLILQGKENAIIHNLVKGNQCILVVPEEIVVRQMNDWFKMIEALLNHVEGDDENDWRMVYPGIYVDAYSVTHLRDMFMGRASDEENALHFDDNQLVKYGVYSIGVYMEDMSCDDTLRMESAFNRGDLRLLIASERMLQIHLARMQAPVVVIEQLKNDLDAPSYLWDLALSTEQIYLMTDDFLHGAELFATRELAMRKEPNLLLPPLTEDLTKTISGKQPLNALDRVVMHAIHIEGWTTPDLIKEYLCHTFSSHPINETLEAEGDRFIKATLNKLARFLTSEPEKPKEGEPAFYKLNAPGLLWFMTQIDRDLDEEITNSRVFHYDNKNDLAAFYYLIPRWFLDEPYIETAGRRDEFARPHEFPTDVMLARKDLMAMLLQHQMHVDDEGDSDINLKRRTFTLILDELLNRYKYEHELTDELELLTGYQERLRISVATQAQAFYIYVSLKGWTFLANYLDNLIDRLYFIIPAQSISLFQLSAMSTWLAYLLIDYEITDPQKFLTADETVMEKIFDDLRIKWFNRPHKLFNRVRQEALLWSMRQSNCAEAKSKKAKLDDGDEANKSLDEPDNENSFGSISLDYLDKDELDELLIHQQQWQQLLSQQRQQNGEDRYSQPKVGPLNVMGDQPIEPRDIASIFYDVDDKKDEKQKEDEAKKTQSTSDAAAAGPSTSKVVKPKASEPAPEPTQAPMPEKNLLGKNFDFVRFLKNFLKPNESTSEQVHVKLPFKNPNTQISAPKYYNWQLLRYGKLHVDYMVLDTVYQINKDLEPMFQALNEERQPTIAIHFEFVPKASATKRVIGLFSHMNKAEEPKGLEVGVSGRVLKTIYLQPLNTNQLFIVQGVAALEALRAIFFERARVLTAVEDDNDIMYFDSKMKRLSIVAYDMKLAATVLHDGFGFDRTYMLQHMSWYDLVTALWLLDPTSKPFELDSFNTVELNTMSMRYKMNPMFYKALFQAGGSRKDCPNKGQLLALALSHIVFGIIDNLVARKVYNVYRTIEAPIKISMFNVEKYGVTINNGYLSDLIDKMRAVKDYLEELIFQQVGYRFNLSSSKEVAQVLHKQLGYLMSFYAIKKDTVAGDANTSFGAAGNSPRGSKKKEEFDLKKLEARKMPKYLETSKVALRKLADMAKNKSNLPQLIIEYRKVTHCLSAILEPIRIALFTQSMELSGTNKAMSIETRGALKLDVKFNEWTATGRIAMHEPNLISIPKAFEVTTLPEQVWEELNKTGVPIEISTTEMGRVAGKVVMRKLVTAREGFCLVSADYSQLELRILANLAKEKTLCDLLNTQNEDVFKLIAAAWRNLKPEDVDYETRQQAKQVRISAIDLINSQQKLTTLIPPDLLRPHLRHGQRGAGRVIGHGAGDCRTLSPRVHHPFPRPGRVRAADGGRDVQHQPGDHRHRPLAAVRGDRRADASRDRRGGEDETPGVQHQDPGQRRRPHQDGDTVHGAGDLPGQLRRPPHSAAVRRADLRGAPAGCDAIRALAARTNGKRGQHLRHSPGGQPEGGTQLGRHGQGGVNAMRMDRKQSQPAGRR